MATVTERTLAAAEAGPRPTPADEVRAEILDAAGDLLIAGAWRAFTIDRSRRTPAPAR